MKFSANKLIISLILFISFVSYVCSDKKSNNQKKQTKQNTSSSQSSDGWGAKTHSTWLAKLDDSKIVPGDKTKKNYYIIFDGSGSMAGEKIHVA